MSVCRHELGVQPTPQPPTISTLDYLMLCGSFNSKISQQMRELYGLELSRGITDGEW